MKSFTFLEFVVNEQTYRLSELGKLFPRGRAGRQVTRIQVSRFRSQDLGFRIKDGTLGQ